MAFTLPQKLEADVAYDSGVKIKVFRREYSRFFIEFNEWWKYANIAKVVAMTQSENAAGWITLTLAYYEAPHVQPHAVRGEDAPRVE